MKIDRRQLAAFLKQPDQSVVGVLVYGPDTGLVTERATSIARSIVNDTRDPFLNASLTPKQVETDPAALVDEANALSLVGGRRVVRVRDASDAMEPALSALLAQQQSLSGPPPGLVVLEGGDMPPRSKLRQLFEKQKSLAAIACYHETGRDLAEAIDDMCRAEGLRLDHDALAYLVENLGGDRGITRKEIEKLGLFAGTDGEPLTRDAVAVMIGDTAEITLEDAVFAAASGDFEAQERALARFFQEGGAAVGALRSLAGHLRRLHIATALILGGVDRDTAMARLKPPVFFKRKAAFQRQLGLWTESTLESALGRVHETEAACKKTGAPDVALCGRAFLDIARLARVASRRAA